MAFHDDSFYNRELSWLRFNHRVLQEAADQRNPLFERLKFLAIFSSNLDEFFEVRVSNIRQIKSLDKKVRKKLITKPNKLLRKIKKEVFRQQELFGQILMKQIKPDLEKAGIFLISHEDYNTTQKAFAGKYFSEELQQTQISQIKVDDNLFIDNEALYLIGKGIEGEIILARIPENTKRFVALPKEPERHLITFVDDVIKYHLKKLYKTDFYAIKASRDAELYIDNEYSGDLLTKIEDSLSKRETGQVTRLLYDSELPEELLHKLMDSLDINETDLMTGGPYHNLKDFFGFPNPTDQNLEFEKLEPIKPSTLQSASSLFLAIKQKDRLFHFPYHSFDDVICLVNEAANDPSVTKIKMTLYRVSKDSAIAQALLQAIKNGKNVMVFIETKARFDEANNIKWGKTLANAGAKVIYSYPGIKVHSKIIYIERTEEDQTVGYAYIGTGNFNEKTARIYTDLGLMTAHQEITAELKQVFMVLERKIIVPHTNHLLVSPFNTRSHFTALIEKEISYAKLGTGGSITIKMNSLQDKQMIDLLYKASNAGVKIKLLIRGICCLVPGVEGQSENIAVTSIIDRFLEHSRVYVFGNAGKELMYIGSADWMTRNLDHRIEVITPILNKKIHKKIRQSLDLQFNDKVKGRIIDIKQENLYSKEGSNGASAQHLIYNMIKMANQAKQEEQLTKNR